MSDKIKVYIDMDYYNGPIICTDVHDGYYPDSELTEIPTTLLDRYNKAVAEYSEVQKILRRLKWVE